jgi:kynurenine formamidase
MHLLDLSQPIMDGGPNCPAHPPVRSVVTANHETGDWQWETLTLASHTGSHIDAPLHKIAGAASVDAIPLDRFAGPAWIADLRPLEPEARISPERLAAALPADLPPDAIVLMATGWGDIREKSDLWLYRSPRITPGASQWLADRNIRGLGVDHWGIGGWDAANDAAVHVALLGRGIWVVEELRFPPEAFALPQPVTFIALPINLKGHSGAWCRPALIL